MACQEVEQSVLYVCVWEYACTLKKNQKKLTCLFKPQNKSLTLRRVYTALEIQAIEIGTEFPCVHIHSDDLIPSSLAFLH